MAQPVPHYRSNDIRTLYIEVSKVRASLIFRRWAAEWRSKDDPTYYESENCAGSDTPTLAYGMTRYRAIRNAESILQNRADAVAIRLRKEREAEETLGRVKIEIYINNLVREQMKLNG